MYATCFVIEGGLYNTNKLLDINSIEIAYRVFIESMQLEEIRVVDRSGGQLLINRENQSLRESESLFNNNNISLEQYSRNRRHCN